MKLVVFSSLDATALPDGKILLTRKFVDGVELMSRHWPGELVVALGPRTMADTNLDSEAWPLSSLPFSVVVIDARSPAVGRLVRDAALVQIGIDYRHVSVARLCRGLGVPYVVVAEYNLRTRLQIAAVEEQRLPKRARRMVWELSQEAQQRRVIAGAAGLQCNGTPTWDAWAHLNPQPMLFFDSRVQPSMLATLEDAGRRGREPVLQLAFSGRFVPMKGVLHLPGIASRLRDRGVRFVLHLWGGGPLEERVRAQVEELGLSERVRFEGNVPFEELMRRVRDEIDLFVCPHVQGDPSCTYLETLSCGVPIAGFANDAWRGLLERTGAGWSAPLRLSGGDEDALADVIAGLDKDRREIASRAARAVQFAREHTFAATFARRMEHLRSVARRDERVTATSA